MTTETDETEYGVCHFEHNAAKPGWLHVHTAHCDGWQRVINWDCNRPG